MARADDVNGAGTVVHVVFGESAAGSLRQALAVWGMRAPVCCLIDDLSLGPLDPPDAEARARWFEEMLGYDLGYDLELEAIVSAIEAFWAAVTSPDAWPIVWCSRRSAVEYAGLLELLRRRDSDGLQIVDVADDVFTRPNTSLSFGVVRADEMIAHGLLDRAVTPEPAVVERQRAMWDRLGAENASLRLVGPDGLVSAPISHFDAMIAALATEEWQRSARIVGDANWRKDDGGFRQTGDQFVWSRLCALVDAGQLEGEGDFASMRTSWVRRR